MMSDTSVRLVPDIEGRDATSAAAKPARTRSTNAGIGVQSLRKSHRGLERPPFACIALVLQGGGALGAFQAGVYQALAEADLHPNWVSGISIGAINAALIAGNSPATRLDKLRAFWEQATTQVVPAFSELAYQWLRGDLARSFLNRLHAAGTVFRGVPGFFNPRLPPPYLLPPGTIEATSWYDP